MAAKTGAQAIVVSNHGGRQLDGAPSSIEVLPEIVDAVGRKMEIMFDGGIRSGQDVMRALALGAKSCMIGRAYIYGLGAGGEAGVAKAIDIIRNELRRHHGPVRRQHHRRDRRSRAGGVTPFVIAGAGDAKRDDEDIASIPDSYVRLPSG